MGRDEARAVLVAAFVAHPDLPVDIQTTLAKLISPKPKKRFLAFA